MRDMVSQLDIIKAENNNVRFPKPPSTGLGTFFLPHLLLIAGNGRNVGKTTLACRIIQHLSQTQEVVGLKISPHFHSFEGLEIIIKNEGFVIAREKQINLKDSSLMLQAGANDVFFAMVKPGKLEEAFLKLTPFLPCKPIVCESGGLHEIATPGLFLMVNLTGKKIVKTHLLKYDPIIVNNDGINFDFNIEDIEFRNHKFSLKK
jgi:hypothetical protein